MNHKILCVDLDATLLCDDKSISQKNRDAIHKMLEAGHYGKRSRKKSGVKYTWVLYDRIQWCGAL